MCRRRVLDSKSYRRASIDENGEKSVSAGFLKMQLPADVRTGGKTLWDAHVKEGKSNIYLSHPVGRGMRQGRGTWENQKPKEAYPLMEKYDVIISKPEYWDILSRRWKQRKVF